MATGTAILPEPRGQRRHAKRPARPLVPAYAPERFSRDGATLAATAHRRNRRRRSCPATVSRRECGRPTIAESGSLGIWWGRRQQTNP